MRCKVPFALVCGSLLTGITLGITPGAWAQQAPTTGAAGATTTPPLGESPQTQPPPWSLGAPPQLGPWAAPMAPDSSSLYTDRARLLTKMQVEANRRDTLGLLGIGVGVPVLAGSAFFLAAALVPTSGHLGPNGDFIAPGVLLGLIGGPLVVFSAKTVLAARSDLRRVNGDLRALRWHQERGLPPPISPILPSAESAPAREPPTFRIGVSAQGLTFSGTF